MQVAIDIEREAAALRLGDIPGLPGLEGDLLASGYHHGLHVAVDHDRFVFVRPHGAPSEEDSLPPSVEIVPPRSRAALSVCQHRLAHFTREGNSRTPESAASLPKDSSAGAAGWVSRA